MKSEKLKSCFIKLYKLLRTPEIYSNIEMTIQWIENSPKELVKMYIEFTLLCQLVKLLQHVLSTVSEKSPTAIYTW